ncbi:hypothetical protein FKM82_029839 [Ascaphus truei]
MPAVFKAGKSLLKPFQGIVTTYFYQLTLSQLIFALPLLSLPHALPPQFKIAILAKKNSQLPHLQRYKLDSDLLNQGLSNGKDEALRHPLKKKPNG